MFVIDKRTYSAESAIKRRKDIIEAVRSNKYKKEDLRIITGCPGNSGYANTKCNEFSCNNCIDMFSKFLLIGNKKTNIKI